MMASIFERFLPLKYQSINRVLENSCRKLYAIIVNAVSYEQRMTISFFKRLVFSSLLVLMRL